MNIKCKKIISILTLGIFALSDLALAVPTVSVSGGISSSTAREISVDAGRVSKVLLNASISIPSEIGTVEFDAPGKVSEPQIFHVQTAHGHYEAQKNIAHVLEFLSEQYGVKTVFLEGASEQVYGNVLNFFPDQPEKNIQIAHGLAKEALVKGAELYLLQNPESKGIGIESSEDYIRNRESFQEVMLHKSQSTQFLADFQENMSRLEAVMLNSSLRSALKQLDAHDLNTELLGRKLTAIRNLSEEILNVDLSDAGFQVEYPHLVRYFKIEELQADFNEEGFQKEKDLLLEMLQGLAESGQEKFWVKRVQEVLEAKASMGMSVEELVSLFENVLALLSHKSQLESFEHVSSFIGSLILQLELDASQLYEEMDQVEGLIIDQLIQNNDERAFVELRESYVLLSRLFSLQLAPAQYEKIEAASVATCSVYKPSCIAKEIRAFEIQDRMKGFDFSGLEQLDQLYERALSFYEDAGKRDVSMLQNMENHITNLRESDQRSFAVVSGGFHSGPFKKFFKDKGYGYSLISPAITEMDPSGYEKYVAGMLSQGSDFDLSSNVILAKSAIQETTDGFPTKAFGNDVERAFGNDTALDIKNEMDVAQLEDILMTLLSPSVQGVSPKNFLGRIRSGLKSLQARGEVLLSDIDIETILNSLFDIYTAEPDLAFARIDSSQKLTGRFELREEMQVGVIGSLGSQNRLTGMIKELGHDVVTYNEENVHWSSMEVALEQNEVVFFSPEPDALGDYDEYQQRLQRTAAVMGQALAKIRLSRDTERRVLVIRTLGEPGLTESVYNKLIQEFREKSSLSEQAANIDVVFQPDFSFEDSEGNVKEKSIVFGFRSESSGYPGAERKVTERALQNVYFEKKVRFLDLKTAEIVKDFQLIYLASKLAHFNDVAQLSEYYGADLSVAALGAGLDARLRTLFANPSQGFGGRLLLYLNWIRDKYTVAARDELGLLGTDEVRRRLDVAMARLRDKTPIEKILSELPPALHMLFLVHSILEVNDQTRRNFVERIERTEGSLEGKVVTVLGVGHSHKSDQMIHSPASKLIEKMMVRGVRKFYIVDPQARLAVTRWIEKKRSEEKRLLRHGRRPFSETFFHGIDDFNDKRALDFTEEGLGEAIDRSDFVVAATDSFLPRNIKKDNKLMEGLPVGSLARMLRGKVFYDGINLAGLRANSDQIFHSIEDLRQAGVNYVSVGRPAIGPKFDSKDNYLLSDSELIRDTDDLDKAIKKRREALGLGKSKKKKVSVKGGGYVGLVTSALISDLGHSVHMVDIPEQQEQIDALNQDDMHLHIHEPGLKPMLTKNRDKKRIKFSTDSEKSVEESSVVYLAVGTPSADDGSANLDYILNATLEVGESILKQKKAGEDHYKVIVVKSTVPPNTFDEMNRVLQGLGLVLGEDYALASNPEFLREGQAMVDVTEPDRTVLGFYSAMSPEHRMRAELELLELWYPLMKRKPHKLLLTDTGTSTIIKYLANSFLAISITDTNFFAAESMRWGASFSSMREILSEDIRIGEKAFLWPGCGYGGSCFPKDVLALFYSSEVDADHPLMMIMLAHQFNEYFKTAFISDREVQGKKIALLGMTFKENTDDMRETSSVANLKHLLDQGASEIHIYDPILEDVPDAPPMDVSKDRYLDYFYKAYENDPAFIRSYREGAEAGISAKEYFKDSYFMELFGERVFFHGDLEEVKDVDVVLAVTGWSQFREIDPDELLDDSGAREIWDARNVLFNRAKSGDLSDGIKYYPVGEPMILTSRAEERQTSNIDVFARHELRVSGKDDNEVAELTRLMQGSGFSLSTSGKNSFTFRYDGHAVDEEKEIFVTPTVGGIKDLVEKIFQLEANENLRMTLPLHPYLYLNEPDVYSIHPRVGDEMTIQIIRRDELRGWFAEKRVFFMIYGAVLVFGISSVPYIIKSFMNSSYAKHVRELELMLDEDYNSPQFPHADLSIVRAFQAKDEFERQEALKLLALMYSNPKEDYSALLTLRAIFTEHPEYRKEFFHILEKLIVLEEEALDGFTDEQLDEQSNLIELLGEADGNRQAIIEMIRPYFKSKYYIIRVGANRALRRLGASEETVSFFVPYLTSDEPVENYWAFDGLRRYAAAGDEEKALVVEALISKLAPLSKSELTDQYVVFRLLRSVSRRNVDILNALKSFEVREGADFYDHDQHYDFWAALDRGIAQGGISKRDLNRFWRDYYAFDQPNQQPVAREELRSEPSDLNVIEPVVETSDFKLPLKRNAIVKAISSFGKRVRVIDKSFSVELGGMIRVNRTGVLQRYANGKPMSQKHTSQTDELIEGYYLVVDDDSDAIYLLFVANLSGDLELNQENLIRVSRSEVNGLVYSSPSWISKPGNSLLVSLIAAGIIVGLAFWYFFLRPNETVSSARVIDFQNSETVERSELRATPFTGKVGELVDQMHVIHTARGAILKVKSPHRRDKVKGKFQNDLLAASKLFSRGEYKGTLTALTTLKNYLGNTGGHHRGDYQTLIDGLTDIASNVESAVESRRNELRTFVTDPRSGLSIAERVEIARTQFGDVQATFGTLEGSGDLSITDQIGSAPVEVSYDIAVNDSLTDETEWIVEFFTQGILPLFKSEDFSADELSDALRGMGVILKSLHVGADAVSYFETVLASSDVIQGSRDILGELFQLFMDPQAPVHLIVPVQENWATDAFVSMVMGLTHPLDEMSFILEGEMNIAESFQAQFDQRIRELGLAEILEGKVKFVAVQNSDELTRVISHRIDSVRVKNHSTGVLANDEELEKFNRAGVAKLNRSDLTEATATFGALAFLRQESQFGYEILALKEWLQSKGYTPESIASALKHLQQVIKRFATSA